MPGNRAEQNRRIVHALRHGSYLVERTSERRHAEAAHPAVARLQTIAIAEARRLAYRTAGIGAERRNAEIPADRRRASARRTTGHARQIIRVSRLSQCRILSR